MKPTPSGVKTLAVDEVAAHVADDRHAAVLLGPGVAAIDRHAGRAGEIAGGAAAAFDRSRHVAGHAQLACARSATARRGWCERLGLRAVGGDARRGDGAARKRLRAR